MLQDMATSHCTKQYWFIVDYFKDQILFIEMDKGILEILQQIKLTLSVLKAE